MPGEQSRTAQVQEILDLLPPEKERFLAVQEVIILVNETIAEDARQIQERQAEYQRKAAEIHSALTSTGTPINLDIPTNHPNAKALQAAIANLLKIKDDYSRNQTANSERLVTAVTELAPIIRREIDNLFNHLRTTNERLTKINSTLSTYFSLFTDETITRNRKIIAANNSLIAALQSDDHGSEELPAKLASLLGRTFLICKMKVSGKDEDYEIFKTKTMGMIGIHCLEEGETPEDFAFSKTEVMLTALTSMLKIPHLPNIDISGLRDAARSSDQPTLGLYSAA